MVVAPMQVEDDYASAFLQLERALQQLGKEAVDCQVVTEELGVKEDALQWGWYLAAVEKLHGPANLDGLYVGRSFNRDRISLKDFFVPPDLLPLREALEEERNPEGDLNLFGKELRVLASDPKRRVSDESVGDKDETTRVELKKLKPERAKALSQIGKGGKLAIVGDPGQGKSSLLQTYLLEQSRSILNGLESGKVEGRRPFFLRLSVWEEGGAPSDVEAFRKFALCELLKQANVSKEAAMEWMQGPVHWLLDGVDEVRNRKNRRKLRSLILALESEDSGKDAWTVTSRPSGYFQDGMGAGWVEWELADLDEEQGKKLLDHWADILVKLEGLRFRGAEVMNDLKGHSGLSRVIGNPLMMTMIVLFYKTRRRLPEDRGEFYDHATQALAEAWQTYRSRLLEREIPHFQYLHRFLGKVALWMMERGVVVVERGQFEGMLEVFLKERGYSGKQLDDEIREFSQAAEDLIGVIVSKGASRFGFLHLSFQEYYAATEIRNGEYERQAAYVRFWDHPDWVETWDLFVLSVSSRERLVLFFEKVLTESHEWDEELRRPEFRCLEWAGMTSVFESNDDFIATVVKRGLSGDNGVDVMNRHQRIAQSFCKSPLPELVKGFLLKALADEDEDVRSSAVAALRGRVGDSEIRESLLKTLADEDENVRSSAVGALGRSVHELGVRESLLKALADENARVRSSAGEVLQEWILKEKFSDRVVFN